MSEGPGSVELLPITIKAIAWLKKQYVEFKEPGINLCIWGQEGPEEGEVEPPHELGGIISNAIGDDLDAAIKEELTGAGSFLELVVVVQMHAVLAETVKELSKDYWYSTTYGLEAGESLTFGSLKKLLVNFDAGGECWRMLGFHLTDQEAEDLVRLMENLDGDKCLRDDMVFEKIML